MQKKQKRDVEKIISIPIFAAKLRRLADRLERGGRFRVQVAGERICVPARAEFSIEYEREGTSRELEFQIKWTAP